MPLVTNQQIIYVSAMGGTPGTAIEKLKKELDALPDCRVVAITVKDHSLMPGTEMVAVVEMV